MYDLCFKGSKNPGTLFTNAPTRINTEPPAFREHVRLRINTPPPSFGARQTAD